MAARHVGGGPGFVDEDEAAGVARRLAANEKPPLLGYVGPILLGGAETLFLSVMFCALRNRHKLAILMLIPRPARAPRISCNVRSGCQATSFATTARCSGRHERRSPPIARGSA
jgi:hypothetical protein